MYLTEAQLKERLNNSRNFLKNSSEGPIVPEIIKVEHKPLHAQKGNTKKSGDDQIPPFIRGLIGAAALEGSGKEVAEAFDVSLPTVYQAKDGNKSSGTPDPEAKPIVNSKVEEIKNQALDMTLAALENLTPDKLEGAKAKDLASIAASTASVYEKIKGRESGGGAQVVIYAPTLKQENDYREVHVGLNGDKK